MLRNKALIVLAALGGISATSPRAEAQQLKGSDTLFDVMTDLLATGATCAQPGLSYIGGGSGEGQNAILASPPTQQIAPMSRYLNGTAASSATNEGLKIGLDALSVIADKQHAGTDTCVSSPSGTGPTLRYNRSPALQGFTFDDWRDVLRLLYAGYTDKVAADPLDGCTANAPAASPSAATAISGRCSGAARKALIAGWNEMFQDACSNGNCPGGLRHAWRRDDLSGTTDTFLSLLGLTNNTTRPFCNGLDTEDLDPARTPCDDKENVCSNIPYANRNFNPDGTAAVAPSAATNPGAKGGDLGVVQAINLVNKLTPTQTDAELAALRYAPNCSLGKFSSVPMAFESNLEEQRCPDGNARALSRCRWPYVGTTPPKSDGTGGKFNCLANKGTVPPISTFTNMDGRAYNLVPRNPDTGDALVPTTLKVGTTSVPSNDARWGGGGAYRIHQSTIMANAVMPSGVTSCKESDATRQIGCLVNADPCTIGYAGREALHWHAPAADSVDGINLRSAGSAGAVVTRGEDSACTRSLSPVQDCASDVKKLESASGAGCTDYRLRYPLSRSLFINTVKGWGGAGFPNITGAEGSFMQCVATKSNSAVDNAMFNRGFIRTSGSSFTDICLSPNAGFGTSCFAP